MQYSSKDNTSGRGSKGKWKEEKPHKIINIINSTKTRYDCDDKRRAERL